MLQPYLLELEGHLAGRFFDFSGGMAHADVIEERPVGPRSISHKHLGNVSYDAMVLACGAGMSRALYKWIGETFDGSPVRKSGGVIVLDNDSKPSSRIDFKEALIESLVLPDLNSSQNKDAVMILTVRPEFTRLQKPATAQDLGVYNSAMPKAWSVSNFRIQIDGLAIECQHVTHINSLILKEGIKATSVGALEPTAVSFPDISLEVPGLFAKGFYDWHKDFVLNGNNSSINEKSGTIDFFAPGSSSPYFTLALKGLGITSISAPKAPSQSIPTKVQMYCESMSFSAGGAAIK